MAVMPDFPDHVISSRSGPRPWIIGRREDLPPGIQPVNLFSLAVLLKGDPDISDVQVKGPVSEPTRIEVMMDDITAAKYKARFGTRLTIEPNDLLEPFS